MFPSRLYPGDAVGVICPSHIAGEADYRKIAGSVENLGLRVKLGENIYKDTYGYLASEQERADDLNRMAADPEVKMVLFGGGMGAAEILPLIDYECIRRNPKIFASYSDGTFILSAVHAKTGLVTYYGLGAGEFRDLRYYDYTQFASHFFEGRRAEALKGGGNWRVLRPGACEGMLTGGYAAIFAMLLNTEYFSYDPFRKYILFLEDHVKFSGVAAVSVCISAVERNPFIENVGGLIFGCYADDVPGDLLRRLQRFGEKHGVPVVYTEDFGHGVRHSILPIGIKAELDTGKQTLGFLTGQ
ncbi:MAG: LD-carboxypeptidase [Firmicutes bacterium]|nr:LD-carboxypeptidase [Bacillota bacterium]